MFNFGRQHEGLVHENLRFTGSGSPGDPAHRAVADSIHASLADEVAWHLCGVVLEPVEGQLSILADLDEVAVWITHVAAPFPAAIV